MVELRQQIEVAREGTVKTSGDEFILESLGEDVAVSLQYSLAESEKHGLHGRIFLTNNPTVLGGYFPVVQSSYSPFDDSSAFQFRTTEFQERYEFIIRQPIDVWAHQGAKKIVAESRMVVKGPERHPGKLDFMPTTIVDRQQRPDDVPFPFSGPPLIFAANKPKQEFQLLVDPFGGQSIKKTARIEIGYADSREPGKLLIVPEVANLPGSGFILADGTGAVFLVTGLQPQRNYTLVLDVDGTKKYTWQATTKTGPYYDDFRTRINNG